MGVRKAAASHLGLGDRVAPSIYLFSQATLLGGVREQAMVSVIPEESWAQAVSSAVRRASASVAPTALRQSVLPLNSMQTSQLYWSNAMEE